MAQLARTVTHKYTGEQITFLETAAETNGQYLYIEVALPPNGDGPPLHMHDAFEEEFEVMSGTLTVTVGKEQKVLTAGKHVVATIGKAHTFNNKHAEPVVFRVRLTPPSQFEESVRIHYGLMDDGLTDEKGNPKKLAHTALILSMQNTLIVGLPIWLQRSFFKWIVKRNKNKQAYKSLEKYIGKSIL